MNFEKVPKLRIGNLDVNIPIIQGGMGVGISLSGLASAVANEGGIGVIATAGIGMLEPDFNVNFTGANERALSKEIKKAKSMTDGAIGINIMTALSDSDNLVDISIEEGADFVFLGAGLPMRRVSTFPEGKLIKTVERIIPIVSSARAVKIIFNYWAKNYNYVPNAIVVEGPLAGGHLGFKKEQIDNPDYSLEKILPEIISLVKSYEQQFNKKIAIIAAGGIYTGEDIYKIIQLGVQGVQLATRFVTTFECDADIKFKQEYLRCKKEDIIIINSPVGLPGRAIRNKFLEDVVAGIKQPFKCFWRCLKVCDYKNAPYCIGLALTNAKKGDLKGGFAFAGANAYRAKEIISVKTLIETLSNEYNQAISGSIS
jgi:NAD(P)H-dependent flavin oxidoreductase YrpB (nitropropane dioxygenase family)